jgi:hypothetical protein
MLSEGSPTKVKYTVYNSTYMKTRKHKLTDRQKAGDNSREGPRGQEALAVTDLLTTLTVEVFKVWSQVATAILRHFVQLTSHSLHPSEAAPLKTCRVTSKLTPAKA